MKQMVRNWKELESLGKEIYRDENGVIHIDAPMWFYENLPILQKINDLQGRQRFICESGIPNTEITGFTSVYCKWTLNGTMLTCVCAGTIAIDNPILQEKD